jgi:hypothetical protein
MKKKVFIMSILLIGLMAAIYSCSKNDANRQANDKVIVQQGESKIITDILKFKERMKYLKANSNEKNGVMMSADSAIYFMEGTINIFHSFNNLPHGEVEVYKDTISFPAADSLSESEVAIKYDEVFQTVRGHYINSSLPEKHLTYVNVELIGNKGSEQLIVSSAIKGEKAIDPDNEMGWMWGNNLGRCDGSIIEGDAAQNLTSYINDEYGYNEPCLACTWTFPSVATKTIFQNEILTTYQNDYNQDNYLDYKIYYADQDNGEEFWTDDTKCVGHGEEELFYRQEYSNIVETYTIFDNELSEFSIECKEYGNEEVGNKIIWHQISIAYGVPVMSYISSPTDIQ